MLIRKNLPEFVFDSILGSCCNPRIMGGGRPPSGHANHSTSRPRRVGGKTNSSIPMDWSLVSMPGEPEFNSPWGS